MSESMVERAAKAIVASFEEQGGFVSLLFGDDPDGPVWEGRMEGLLDGRVDAMKLARAAIAAMKAPPPAIDAAIGRGMVGSYRTAALLGYERAIDAALAEDAPPR